jgi:hypothetical protein
MAISTQIEENVVAFSAPDGASFYAWSFGDGFSAEGQNLEHTYPLENETYTVTLFMSNGCIEGYAETQINIVINSLDRLSCSVRIFPNPGREFISVSGMGSAPSDYWLFDASGRLAAAGNIHDNGVIDISALQSGMYILSLKMPDETLIRKPIFISR